MTEPAAKRQKTERGQNKSRKKANKIKINKFLICPLIVKGKLCELGDKCKFPHDVQGYLDQKPADLGEMCPFFQTIGQCPYGYSCRFAGAHMDKELKLLTKNNEPRTEGLNTTEKLIGTNNGLTEWMFKNVFQCSKKDPQMKFFPIARKLVQYFEEFDRVYGPGKSTSAKKQNHQDDNKEKTKDVEIEEKEEIPKNVFILLKEPEVNDNLESKENTDTKSKENIDTEPQNGNAQNKKSRRRIPSTYANELDFIPLEKRPLNFKNKLYLAPLTTVGNLPFRRICKEFGADITCSEMALTTNLLRGAKSEWALLKRHASEDVFGIQLASGHVDSIARALELMNRYQIDYDFLDLNVGCPLDEICSKRCGAGLMQKPYYLRAVVRSMHAMTNKPITVKLRKGYFHDSPNAMNIIKFLPSDGVSYVTIHGRSRQQRYRREADWDYIKYCQAQQVMPILGNGDVYNWQDFYTRQKETQVETCMIGRGALIKPWLFQEIKEQREIDISSSERLDIFKKFVNYGLLHWGSDDIGVENTRKFLLEWMSFTHRYVPVGILERPMGINEMPPEYIGRNDLETLLQSKNVNDWVKISELLLGKVKDGFNFVPKHKAASFAPQFGSGFEMNALGELVRSAQATDNVELSSEVLDRINKNDGSILGKRTYQMTLI